MVGNRGRLRILVVLSLVIGVVVAPPAASGGAAITDGVALELVATGLSRPVDLTAPVGDDRLFVVEKAGRIRIIEDGAVLPTPFLDITGPVDAGAGERGLLGLAFDNDYDSNGRFYVNYTADSGGGDSRLARYDVSGDPYVADAGSGVTLLQIDQPYSNHNGGQVAMGPDGYLYASFGDGGSGGDPQGNGQNTNTLLGSIVRVDPVTGNAAPDNPFVGGPGADEIWAYGLRNPWRFDFDDRTGDMFIADVGEGSWEEIDRIPAGVGGLNFGWNEREGAHCYVSNCETAGLTDPIVEYAHQANPCSGSITGGKVYRGNDLPLLRGHYFYIDYCKGGLRSFAFEDGQVVEQTNWDFLNPPSTVVSFGTDGFGEMYLMAGSSIYKFVSTANPRCDFDGDGAADLPVGVPGENRSGTVDAGMLQVFDGDGSGFDPAADARFWQGINGVRGMLERLDEFGAAVTCGDFDGDGYSDLAIGSPGERRNLRKQAGQVNVLYGGPNGLSGIGDQMWTQDSNGIKSAAQKGDRFGQSLAAGDFDGDGIDDLAIGSPGERLNGNAGAGAVHVLYGDGNGLTAVKSDFLHQNVNNVLDESEAGDGFGSALAAGDFDGDGNDDLAVGIPNEDVAGESNAGMVQVFPGSRTGLTKADAVWHRDRAGIEGDADAGAEFGFSLATGHLNADGFDDLVVGVPGDASAAGSVSVLYGGSDGFGDNDALLNQGAGGIPGPAEAGDRFGHSIAVGDFNGDGVDDAAIGAPHESRSGTQRAGDATVLYGTGIGLSGAGSYVWHQGRNSLQGGLLADNLFGSTTAALDLDGDGHADLVVGATNGDLANARGELHFIPGSSSGLTGNGDVRWDQGTAGVLGSAQNGDRFGEGLP